MKWTKLSIEDRILIEKVINNSLQYSEVWIDFFCGFGGVTAGIERTKLTQDGIATVIACLNHDENAIGSHKLSHPHCYHITEDIRTAYTDILKYMVREIRRKSAGRIKVKLWFSHECTHYSIAKGGDSRDADSRSLPEELFRYVDDLQPDAIWIENVREFLTWGPLIQKRDANGELMWKDDEPWMIPDPNRKAEYFNQWKSDMISRGFSYDHRILCCADYGCPTIRKRVFIQFLKDEEIVWAKPTHSKGGVGGLKPWIPIRECLDTEDKGTSIFAVKPSGKLRIQSRKTYKRIYDGCIKILEPLFEQQLREYELLVSQSFGNGVNMSADSPSPMVATKNIPQIVQAIRFITQYYGSGNSVERNRSIEEPASALSTNPRERVIDPQFISNYYSGGDQTRSLDNPSSSLTTEPKSKLVSSEFIMNTNYSNPPTLSTEPSPTITANRKRHYLINMQFSNTGQGIDQPSMTLVAKMDKKPNYLITTEEGGIAIEVYKDDFPEVILIKEFMAKWSIADIYMRELRIPEMLKIHTMPPDLPMVGTITERKKFIGNQVPAQIVTELILASYYGNKKQIAA